MSRWQKFFSARENKDYWYNADTEEVTWEPPQVDVVLLEPILEKKLGGNSSSVASNVSPEPIADATPTSSSKVITQAGIDDEIRRDWTRHFSSSKQMFYWYNPSTGASTWDSPGCSVGESFSAEGEDGSSGGPIKKRVAPDRFPSPDSSFGPYIPSRPAFTLPTTAPKIAIIVPFRDLHVEQHRARHLAAFVPHMLDFLRASGEPFHIYIMQQSNDGRKFNRGKLLNIGFRLACDDGCRVFVFHDVDLLPSVELRPCYTTEPIAGPVHIAKVWHRYTGNSKYFGGVVAFTREQFQRMNGFPNTFWGWGGEDDELYNRLVKVSLLLSPYLILTL